MVNSTYLWFRANRLPTASENPAIAAQLAADPFSVTDLVEEILQAGIPLSRAREVATAVVYSAAEAMGIEVP